MAGDSRLYDVQKSHLMGLLATLQNRKFYGSVTLTFENGVWKKTKEERTSIPPGAQGYIEGDRVAIGQGQ